VRTVWATVLAVWALLAVIAVLAWTRQQAAPRPTGPQTVVVRGKNGKTRVVAVQSAPAGPATTRSSPVPAG
jgi:cyanate permease